MSEKPTLKVNLFWSPALGQEGFSGEAWAVSSANKVGKFDILPHHSNFITQVFDNLTIHTLEKKDLNFKFARGVLEVSQDQVKIFLGI